MGIRRSAVLGMLAASPVFARSAIAQSLVTVRVASAPNIDLIALLWALESGMFRTSGLDISVQFVNSGAAGAVAVAGGAVELAHANLVSWMTGRSKGISFMMVAPAGIYDVDVPDVAMIVAKDSPIKTGADMNGKTCAVSALNDLGELGTKAWIDANGGDSKTVHFIEIPTSAIGNAVATGRADAGTVSTPSLSRALATGQVRSGALVDTAIAPRFMESAYVGLDNFVTRNRTAAATFRRIIDSAGAYANGHFAEMVPVIAKYLKTDPAVVAAQPQTKVGTSLDLRLIQPLVKDCIRYGILPQGFDVNAMIDQG